jgi:glycosyltransferase 2 family protein
MRALPIVLTAGGVALATWLIGQIGFNQTLMAVTSVGWHGFLLVALAQIGLFLILGAGWAALLPRSRVRHLPAMIWGRAVRDSAALLLPFSALGGFVAGARAVTLQGIAWPVAAATTFTDVTTEFLAQLAFALFGLLVLLRLVPDSGLIAPLSAGLVVALGLGGLAIVLQRGVAPIFRFLGGHIAGPWLSDVTDQADRVQAEIDQVHRGKGWLALGFALHLSAWFGTGAAAWLAFHLLGADVTFVQALAIEAVLHAALTLTFMVPGAVGVQELAYTALGAVFGCPPEVAIAVSLLRRARDVALGVPVLLGWQYLEARRLRQE